ncbi:hypothetical protein ABZ815_20160 [Nonomuraea sp. NPDC047529]|uniref:hypothetical protein n=1 Tax=Nonomuraea sp. NPDC047529 TaxID=3155623 RepID=UPI0033C4A973
MHDTAIDAVPSLSGPPEPHYHLESAFSRWGFAQTVPTWLAKDRLISPPGDTPGSYAVMMYMPAGQTIEAVWIALRNTKTTTGTWRAAIYESGHGQPVVPVAGTAATAAGFAAGWAAAPLYEVVPAASEGRWVHVVLSLGLMEDGGIAAYKPDSTVAPFIPDACWISMQHDEPPAVLELGQWQTFGMTPLIALR